ARRLGWPEGTFSVRLARGRKMLAKRLARRGFVLSAALLATVLGENTASAGVPSPLLVATVKAARLFAAGQAAVGLISAKAVVLSEGGLKTMFLTKAKIITAVLFAAGVTGLISGAGLYRTLAAPPPEAQRKVASRQEQATDVETHKGVSLSPSLNGSLMFGVGVNSDAGLTGSVIVNERNF